MAYQHPQPTVSSPSGFDNLSDSIADAVHAAPNFLPKRYRTAPPAFEQILFLGLYHARHQYLQAVDAQDCAMELIHHLVRDASQSVPLEEIEHWFEHLITDPESRRQLRQQAARHAYNFARRKRNEALHFATKNEVTDRDWDQWPDTALTPLDILLRHEIIDTINVALESFTPEDRALFQAYHEFEHSLDEVAVAHQMSTRILKQRLYRIRKRLKKRMEKMGCNEAEMQFCLALSQRVRR